MEMFEVKATRTISTGKYIKLGLPASRGLQVSPKFLCGPQFLLAVGSTDSCACVGATRTGKVLLRPCLTVSCPDGQGGCMQPGTSLGHWQGGR